MRAGSLDRTMRIARELLDEIIAHAQAEAPNECCGMVASRDGQAVKVYRAANEAVSPKLSYFIGLSGQWIYDEIYGAGLDLGAFYHSHTRTDPDPSQTDVNLASPFYPDSLYVIVGLKNDEPEVRAFSIRDGQVTGAELVVE